MPALEAPATVPRAPRRAMTTVKLDQASGRDASRGGAPRGASGGAIAGAAEMQWAQHRCSILALCGAVPSFAPAPPAPWQMALSGSDTAIAAACAAATPARKACSTMSHAAIRTVGRRHAVAANAVGT